MVHLLESRLTRFCLLWLFRPRFYIWPRLAFLMCSEGIFLDLPYSLLNDREQLIKNCNSFLNIQINLFFITEMDFDFEIHKIKDCLLIIQWQWITTINYYLSLSIIIMYVYDEQVLKLKILDWLLSSLMGKID